MEEEGGAEQEAAMKLWGKRAPRLERHLSGVRLDGQVRGMLEEVAGWMGLAVSRLVALPRVHYAAFALAVLGVVQVLRWQEAPPGALAAWALALGLFCGAGIGSEDKEDLLPFIVQLLPQPGDSAPAVAGKILALPLSVLFALTMILLHVSYELLWALATILTVSLLTQSLWAAVPVALLLCCAFLLGLAAAVILWDTELWGAPKAE